VVTIVGAVAYAIRGGCFVEGTLILTPDGLAPIERLQAGDFVVSIDPQTGELRKFRVVRAFVQEADHIVEVETSADTIRATTEHPLFVEERGWVPAGEMEVGDALVSGRGLAKVLNVTRLNEPSRVYNLQVEVAHSYLVGDELIWAHNASSRSKPATEAIAQSKPSIRINLIGKANAAEAGRAGTRGRFQRSADAEEQLQSITKNQTLKRKAGQPDAIRSIEKSRTRAVNANKRIRNLKDALEEFD
jgi:hypothetical protein